MSQFFTWDALVTYSGAALFTGFVVQLIKGWIDDYLRKIPTALVAYAVALVTLVLAVGATEGFTWQNTALAAFNAVIVAAASSGGHAYVSRATGSANTKDNGGTTDDGEQTGDTKP